MREVAKVPLNPSDKRGKTSACIPIYRGEKIPSYLLPLSGKVGI